MSQTTDTGDAMVLGLGPERLVIDRRYEVLSILNDFLIGIWFLVGSWLFFYPALESTGIWLFVIGSLQFLVRPVIRLARHVHVQRATSPNWDY